jgi:hypothetical protein
MSASFFATKTPRWRNGRQALSMYFVASQPHSVVKDEYKTARLVWGVAWDFHLQNAPDREVQQAQVWWKWQLINQSPEFHQQLLGGPGSVGWSWIQWKRYFRSVRLCPLYPGDHMLSQKLLVDFWHWLVRRQKPVIGGLNPQDLSSCCLHHFCLPLSHGIRSMSSFGSFFIMRIRFMLLLRSSWIFILCCPSQSTEQSVVASHLHGDWGPNLTSSPIYTIACTATKRILLILSLTAPQHWWQQACYK